MDPVKRSTPSSKNTAQLDSPTSSTTDSSRYGGKTFKEVSDKSAQEIADNLGRNALQSSPRDSSDVKPVKLSIQEVGQRFIANLQKNILADQAAQKPMDAKAAMESAVKVSGEELRKQFMENLRNSIPEPPPK